MTKVIKKTIGITLISINFPNSNSSSTMFNRIIASALPYFPKKLVWLFSRSYISGETIEDAIRISEEFNRKGIKVTLDVLGEFISDISEAETNKAEYFNLIDIVCSRGIDGNFSLKPTSFGLLIDKEICYLHIREIVSRAASYNSFIRIDMEDSPCTDLEIELFRRLKAEFPANVGLVVQAYLKRTLSDVKGLADLNNSEHPLSFRLCKGIYVEPEAIAYKDHDEINLHFLEDLEYMLSNKIHVGIATHDKFLVEGSYDLLKKYNVPRHMYEFQMLYGVTPGLRDSIVKAGHTMRIYVPFGKEWFGYSTRRLKENPKMASHIIKAIFIKG